LPRPRTRAVLLRLPRAPRMGSAVMRTLRAPRTLLRAVLRFALMVRERERVLFFAVDLAEAVRRLLFALDEALLLRDLVFLALDLAADFRFAEALRARVPALRDFEADREVLDEDFLRAEPLAVDLRAEAAPVLVRRGPAALVPRCPRPPDSCAAVLRLTSLLKLLRSPPAVLSWTRRARLLSSNF
jgi:hypothetical protein